MSRKVFISMLVLCGVFLVGQYVLAKIFPEQFLQVVSNPQIVRAGQYIDSHAWSRLLFYSAVSVLFDWLYFGAVIGRRRLPCSLILIIISYALALNVYYVVAPSHIVAEYSNIVFSVSGAYMILTPMFYTKSIKGLSITYTVNLFAQLLALLIKGVVLTTANANAITTFLISIDNYIWLVLCYLIFNYNKSKKEE